MACEECEDVRDALIGAIKTLEALLKLKGATKPPEPKKVALSRGVNAVLHSDGYLLVIIDRGIHCPPRIATYSNPFVPTTFLLSSEETKRLTSFLKDGE